MEDSLGLRTLSFNNLGYYGRLGNQMFQYAALLGSCRLLNCEGIAPTGVRSGCSSSLRECFRLGFCIDAVEQNINAQYSEQDFSFNADMIKTIMGIEGNVDILGYFQSDKYWKHCEDLVMREFKFHDSNHMVVDNWIAENKINIGDYISIHVRRGDYLNLQDTHPLQNDEYYLQAMEFFPDKKFLVFSDDMEWARDSELFCNLEGVMFADLNQYQDLNLMSRCSGHIVANSSFSWWGSALSGNKTVAPKCWFGPKGFENWEDIYREDWKVI